MASITDSFGEHLPHEAEGTISCRAHRKLHTPEGIDSMPSKKKRMNGRAAIGLAPDPEPLHRLADQAVEHLRAAQAKLNGEAQAIQKTQQDVAVKISGLTQKQTQLTTLQQTLEADKTKLQQATQELASKRQSLQEDASRISQEQIELDNRQQALDISRNQLMEEKEKHANVVDLIAEREQSLETAERQVQTLNSELMPRKQAIEQRELELADREQELQKYANELTETRSALLDMQQQLEHNQIEVSKQREQLISQLGAGEPIARDPHQPTNIVTPRPVTVVEPTPAQPKPASNMAAQQFRKLRRDAKRRAIGA